ncbi:MAG TPA: hypothetical protein VF463_15770 [Sphingobium sp.]
MNWRALILTACCLAGACAGPVRTRYGGALPASTAPAPSLSSLSLAASATDDDARQAVAEALGASGIRVDDHSPYEVQIGLSARPDTVGIFTKDGEAIVAPRRQRLLQSCRNNGYRLALAVSDRRSGAIVAHGWAEESHCAASLASVLPELARQSVAMLTRPGGTGSTLRWTQD